jgi:hypothetical protein
MADPKSTLIPKPEPDPNAKYSTGLRKFREDPKQTINLSFQAPRFDVLFGSSPMKYSTEDKKKWWETKDDKPFKIGLIHSKELDTRISIYGEVFDFSKTATRNGPAEPLQPEELKEVKAIGFESSENVIEEPVLQPETYFTSKDFDRMYLGWLEPTDKIRRSTLKQIFRFVFGNKKIADVKKFKTRLLIAYTPLTPNEKVPCDSQLREDFRKSIEYRRNNLIQETKATKQAIGEDTLYMEKKQKVLMGLRDVLNTMDIKEEQCLLYGDNPEEEIEANKAIQTKDLLSRAPGFSDDDFRRLVFIFQNYIDNQGKFKGKNIPIQGRELYEDILNLLKITLDPSSMVDGKELEDMTKMVEVLSFLLKTFAELHTIHIQLIRIKHALTKRNLEELGTQNEDLEERIRSLTTSMKEGDTDISRLLYRFAQSILKKSQENSETIRKQILAYVEGNEQEIRFQKSENKELRKQLENINEERLEMVIQIEQIETNLSLLREAVPAFQELIEELEKTLQDKTAENTILQQRLQECEQLRQELTIQLEQVYEQRQTLTTLLQNTVTALEQLRVLYDALLIEDTHKAEQIQNLLTNHGTQETQETMIQEMRGTISKLNEEASAVETLLQTLQEQLTTVKTQKQELEGRLQTTDTRLVESEAREEELDKITEQTSTAFQQLYSRTQKVLDDLEEQEVKIQQMAQERDVLRGQLTKQIEESKKKESVLQKEKEDCEERLKKLLEESTAHSEEKDRQIKELEGRLEVLSKEITDVVGRMQDLYIQRDTLESQTQLTQLEHDTERLRIQAEKDVLEEKLKGMVDPQRVAELEQQLQELEKEKQSLLQEAEQKRQQNIANLQTTHTKTVDDLRSENERQQKSFEDTQQALSQAREALTILQGVKGESDIEVSNLQKQIKMLEEQHVKALEDVTEVSKQEAETKIASAVKEMSEQQADLFKQRLAKLKEDEQKREERFIELEKRFQGEVQASEEEKERIRVEYEAESEELTRIIQRKNEEIDSILISLKTSEEEKGELQVEVEILQAENAGLREEVAKLSQQVGRLSEELGTLIEEITEIKRPSGIVRGMVHNIHQKEGQQKERPAWKPVSTGTSRGPTQKTVITRKAGQGGGGKDNCETMLTLLLFHMKENKYDVQEFLDKAGATLDDLGQCPLVLHLLNEMLDEANEVIHSPAFGKAENLQTEKGAVIFSPVRNETSKLVMESLENAIQGRFTEEEQEFLSSLSKPITFYSHPPERFEQTLGSEPYILYDDESEDVVLKGVGDEDIHLTNEERNMIEDGGVSLGAVTFLYLNCLQDMARLNDTTYSPTEVSKCLRAQRSQERAKTPKQKHKRKHNHNHNHKSQRKA